ncbi:MAG: hypothetical protein GY774_29190, partial [Planctomycetes bacterium]|nr:hypothetical protein [Planctomycetota bacterium]
MFERLEVYGEVKKWGKANFLGARIPVNKKLKIDAWKSYAHCLSKPESIDLLEFGFPIGHDYSFIPQPVTQNHKSALVHAAEVREYLDTEKGYGAIIGPFDNKPLEWLMVSPMLTREKSGSAKQRIIIDMSFPNKLSVNDGISKDVYLGLPFKLNLPTPLSLRDRIRELGENAYIWSLDLKRGYRQLSVCPLDWPLLGLTFDGKFFIDTAVCFGLRSGAKFMQDTSNSVVEILRYEGLYALAYIDDIAGANATYEEALRTFTRCEQLLDELGLEQATNKACPPTQATVWLGVHFDCKNMIISIPRDKLNEIHALTLEWLNKKSCTQSELKSILGKLFFAATCNATLRLFVNRLLATQRAHHGMSSVTLDDDCNKDFQWIAEYLQSCNGK